MGCLLPAQIFPTFLLFLLPLACPSHGQTLACTVAGKSYPERPIPWKCLSTLARFSFCSEVRNPLRGCAQLPGRTHSCGGSFPLPWIPLRWIRMKFLPENLPGNDCHFDLLHSTLHGKPPSPTLFFPQPLFTSPQAQHV